MSWVGAGRVEAIPMRGARVLRLLGVQIAIFRTSRDELFALRDVCPHRGGPLSQGIVHGHCVTCPLHDWVIDLATGEAQGPDEGATATFELRVENGELYIRMPEQEEQRASKSMDVVAETG